MKQILIIFLFMSYLQINAQNTLSSVKEVKETVENTTKLGQKASEYTSKTVKKVTKEAPGVLNTIGNGVKSVASATGTAIVDSKNFVDTSSNFRWMLNKTNDFVVSAATAFKVGAEKVLYIMAKKYFLMGIYSWIIVIGSLIVAFFIYKKSSKAMTNISIDDKSWTPFPFIGVAISLGIVVFAFFNLQNAINYTFNPEYYVLQELKDFTLNLLK